MNLYELKENYLELANKIWAGEDDLEDTLESINDSIDSKAENYAKLIRNIEGDVIALDKEIERLKNRKDSLKNSKDRLKKNLMEAMIETGKEKIKTELFSISVANNAPAVHITNENLIPSMYFNVKEIKNLDKERVKKILKQGNEIDGVELTRGRRLNIR